MAPRPPAEPDPSAPVFAIADEEAFRRHFDELGYVVIGGVLDHEQSEATVDELWSSSSLLGGHAGLCRDDPTTWDNDVWPAGSRNFLDPLDPSSEVESWRNRVHPSVVQALRAIWDGLGLGCTGDGGRLVSSVDRFGVMRPVRVATADGGWRERPDWRTSKNWLHWDQNPWSDPGFFGIQGLIALTDADPTTGGFVTVPGFHREFEDWARAHPEGSVPKRTASMVPFPVPLDDEMQDRRIKVSVPKGALLLWDSRMPHENCPNSGEGWRIVQYVTGKRLSSKRCQQRALAWHACLRSGLISAGFARRFAGEEQAWLGMVASASQEDYRVFEEALRQGDALSDACLEAARKLRRAYRLKQTAIAPAELAEASDLFRAAFAVSPALREPLQQIAAAEDSYLPFWIL